VSDGWPQELPPLGPPTAPGTPPVVAAVLPNGLTVWAIRRTGVPLVTLSLTALTGRAFDPVEAPGLAGLLAAGLKEGTAGRSSSEVNELLQSAGAELATAAGDDALEVVVTGLAARLEILVDALADVVTAPAFPARDVARVKSLAREELATNSSEPAFLARRAFRRAVYGEHPYAVISPTEASIDAVTSEALRVEAARRLVPQRALLLAVGDVEPARALDLAARHFGAWKCAGSPPAEPPAASAPSGPHEILILPRPGSVQTQLIVGRLGLTRRDADADALSLLVTIYGGAFSSRLVSNLREEKGYTYSPGATASFSRWRGTVRTAAAVRNEVTGAALNEILYEMNRLATTAVSHEELARGAGRDLGLLALRGETNASLAHELAHLWLHGLGPEERSRQAAALSRLEAPDLGRAARRCLGTGSAHIVAVGDIATLREELSSFGPLCIIQE
jgi:zinc protease